MEMPSRETMVEMLCENLRVINAHRIDSGANTQEELDELVTSERARYKAMSDRELSNMIALNFF